MSIEQKLAQGPVGLVSSRGGFSVVFDGSDFYRVLERYSNELGRSVVSTLTVGAKWWTERAERLTPICKKTVRRHTVDKDGKPVTIRFSPRGRGYARQAWREVRKKMRLRVGGKGYGSWGDVKWRAAFKDERRRKEQPYVEIGSAIPYIDKLDRQHQIETGATHNATVKMLQYLTREARRALAKA